MVLSLTRSVRRARVRQTHSGIEPFRRIRSLRNRRVRQGPRELRADGRHRENQVTSAKPLVKVPDEFSAPTGWEWAAVEGHAQLVGLDDPLTGIDADGLRRLLRGVFSAAGGTHDDWDTFDTVMAAEHRTAVLVTPQRVYSNG
jgi:hypothetical protein